MADEQKRAEKDAQKDTGKDDEKKNTPELKDELVHGEHRVLIGGKEVAYKTTAGRIVMRTEEGKARAAVFFIAYVKQGVGDGIDAADRPLTFSFNGGPGSSSVWMHLGLLGPRRVLSGDVDAQLPPPYRLADNEHSLLDISDLVFIDPVSTGYSRPAEGEEAKQFHNLEADAESVGDFIRLYVTRYKRWRSPKFLIGESYGTTRAAALSGYLQERHGMYLNGLMLISAVLNFQTIDFNVGNDLPHALYLPAFAATAWYHKRLAPDLQADLQATLREVEAFAEGEYTHALMLGNRLQGEARAAVVEKLAHYTGLTSAQIERNNLRPEIMRFTKDLLREQRRTVGRLDSRFIGIDRDAAGETFSYDPSYAFLQGAYTAALYDYVRGELNFESDLPYEVLKGLYETWDYNKHQNQYVNVAETLRTAMTQNPWLKVFVACGYMDLATPYFAAEYTLSHLELDPSLEANISVAYYEAGHMMYVHEPSLKQLRADLEAFISSAWNQNAEGDRDTETTEKAETTGKDVS